MTVFVVISYIFYPVHSGEFCVQGVFSTIEQAEECKKSISSEWYTEIMPIILDKMY